MAIVETLEHYVLPASMVYLTGNDAWWGLASIPLLEIISPVVIQYFKKDVVEEQKGFYICTRQREQRCCDFVQKFIERIEK